MFLIKGTVLKVEPISGGSGENSYAYLRAHVLAGVTVQPCRVGDNYGPAPVAGEDILAEIAVNAYKDRSQGARLGVTLVAPVRDAVAV